MSDFDQFDSLAPQTKATLAFEGEPHAKLKRNLELALDVHHEFMTERYEPAQKFLALQSANTTVKAALTTDRTALKARSDKTLERVFLRLLFLKRQRGDELKPDQMKMLGGAPRAEIEAALGPMLKEYDRMEW